MSLLPKVFSMSIGRCRTKSSNLYSTQFMKRYWKFERKLHLIIIHKVTRFANSLIQIDSGVPYRHKI